MLRIENAEQLAPPKLEFGSGKIELAKTGRGDYGDFDFRNRRFFKELLVEYHLTTRQQLINVTWFEPCEKAATLKAKEWAVIGFGRMNCKREFVAFAEGLVLKGIELGMDIEKGHPYMNIVRDTNEVVKIMKEKKEDLKLLIVVLPQKSSEDYSFVRPRQLML